MATIATETVEIFGTGVLGAEGVVIDKDGNAWGGGRNGKVYKVSPDGKVHEVAQLPPGSIPNGVTLDRAGNFVYCDLGKKAMMRLSPDGQVSMIADRVGTLALSLPNFASYDAEGNLYVSNSSTQDISQVLVELEKPAPNGALVRIRPDGRGEIVAEGIYFANGMAFDVDRNLYVTLPAVAAGGNITPANQILKVDTKGNWSLLIDDRAGAKLSFPTNCAFGGPGLQDLFIANLQGDHFGRVHTSFHGHPLYHQR